MIKTLAVAAALFVATVSAATVTYVRAGNIGAVEVTQIKLPADQAAIAALRQRAADLHQLALNNMVSERRIEVVEATGIMKVRAE